MVEEENEVVTHWGCQLLREDGSVYITRWDPGYGSGIYVPYTEAEARADVARGEPGFPKERKRLVRRIEITTVTTTPWEVAE